MSIRPIRNPADLDAALSRVETLWGAPPGSPEGDELDVLLTLIEAYESKHHAIPAGDPVEVIRFKMSELQITQNQLARQLGWSSGRISEILNRKRGLTLAMVKALSFALGIPSGLLVGDGLPAQDDGVTVTLPGAIVARLREQVGASSRDLETLVLQALERGLSGAKPPRRRPEPVQTPESNEVLCFRSGPILSAHSKLAA